MIFQFLKIFIRTLNGYGGNDWGVSFDGEGLLASGSWDKTIKLWNVKTGECIRTLNGHDGMVYSVSFDREGLLASGSWDNTIKLWNVKTGECIRTLNEHRDYVNTYTENNKQRKLH